MRLGIGTYTYGWGCGVPGYPVTQSLTHAELFRRAAELGVHVVQVCDNLPLHTLPEADLDALKRLAHDLDLTIELGTRGIGDDNLDRHIRLAASFCSPILRVVVDSADERPSEDEVVARMRASVPLLQDMGVVLAIENHDRFQARTLAQIIERIGSEQVGICLDTANSFGALEGPEVVIETLAPYTVNLHVKDFVVQRVPSNMGFVVEGRPAGQGMLDIPWLLEGLQRRGRDVDAILELWTPPEPRLEDTIQKELAWASESVAYLRRLIAQ